jgi:hypothetical protein
MIKLMFHSKKWEERFGAITGSTFLMRNDNQEGLESLTVSILKFNF